jgi:predicted small lipoprotein YifL
MKFICITLATLFLLGILAGCGQSGPLYVPGDPSSINVPPEVPETDEESDENGEDGEDDESQ